LPVRVADDEAGFGFLGRPRRREAAGGWHGAMKRQMILSGKTGTLAPAAAAPALLILFLDLSSEL
jgi:hypothetical protein